MASHHEVNDLLDTIRKELPGRAQEAFEEAAKRAMRQSKQRRGRAGFDWQAFERNLMPPMWQKRNQRQDEGLLPLLTLIIGFIGGAALMYLFDPDRGARRRAMIQVEARRLANEASEAVEETAGKVRAEVERVVTEVEEKVEEGRAEVSRVAGEAADKAGEVRAEVQRVAGETSETVEETAGKVRAEANRVVGEASDKAEELRDQVSKAVDDTTVNPSKPAGTS